MPKALLNRCESLGIRLTGQRRAVVQALEASSDHPNVAELHNRAVQLDPHLSIATVYRTVKLLEEVGLVEKHDFGDGLARYEDADREHHDHLIDINTGRVIEFLDEEIEELQKRIAHRLGYVLRGHRMELYGERRNKE
ncbi:MAG: Fur family transcriptional regulator [Rhodobacteraceae bacterium]|nr:Fur family transcriptional regulator [Paracoccaceae bacterium]